MFTKRVATCIASMFLLSGALLAWHTNGIRIHGQNTVGCDLRVTPSLGSQDVYDGDSIANYSFVIHNDGEIAARIDAIETSCSCTDATFDTNIVPPHGQLKFGVGYKVGGIVGTLPEKEIVVMANGSSCKVKCRIGGTRLRPCTFNPSRIDFGTIPSGERSSSQIEIRTFNRFPDLDPENLVVDLEDLRIELVSHDRLDDGQSLCIRVTLSREAAIGAISGSVFIPYRNVEDAGVRFHVCGQVTGPVQVETGVVRFGTIRDDQTRTQSTKIVASDMEHSAMVTNLYPVKLPKGIEFLTLDSASSFELIVSPKLFESGLHSGRVVIAADFSGRTHSVVVPYLFSIRRTD